MAVGQQPTETTAQPVPLSVLLVWVFGGIAFALIVYLFTPFTHNLDDIKVTLQYVLAPIVWGFFAVALWCGYVRRIHPTLMLSLFGFMLIMLLATILGRFPWRAWHELGFQLTILAPFLVVAGTATNARRFRNTCLFYFLVGCGTVAFGLFHFFGGVGFFYNALYGANPPSSYTPLYTLLFTLRQNGDMLSTILNRDFYAAYLVMIVPLGVALALDYGSARLKVFFLLMFFLMCLCIMLAFSKDSYMALFLMFVIFLILFASRRNWRAVPRPVLWMWCVGGLLVFVTVFIAVRDKLFHNFAWEINTSIMSRKVIWGGAIGIFWDLSRPAITFVKYLLLGGGPGAFYLTFPLYRDPDYHLYEISNVTLFAHNQYLDLLCEEGLLGSIAFMVFLGAVLWFLLREAWRKWRHPLNTYQIALFASLLGVSIQNIFSPNIRWTVCGFNYWFLLGLSVAASHLTFSEDQLRRIDRFYESPPAWPRPAAAAFLLFALMFITAAVPYGLIRFNAAKNNNDGLILLNDFGRQCDLVNTDKYKNNPEFREQTRQLGLDTVEAFRRALQWKPSFITSYYKLAHVYSRMAQAIASNDQEREEWWGNAEATYNELHNYAPDYSEIHLNYGILGRVFYLDTNDPEHLASSLLAFQKAARMSNKLMVQQHYFQTLDAVAGLVTTSSTVQGEVVALFEETLNEMNRLDERVGDGGRMAALRELVRGGEIQKAAALEAEILRNESVRVAEKIPSLQAVEPGDEKIVRDMRRWLVDYHMRRGNYETVLPFLQPLVEEDPANAIYLRAWNDAALQARQPKKCLEVLAQMIERNPTNWHARYAAREVLEMVGDHERSLQQARALEALLYPKEESLAPQRPERTVERAEICHYIAFAAEKTNQLKMALEYYTKGAETNPQSYWGKRCEGGIVRVLKLIEQERPAGAASTPPKPVNPTKPGAP